jgi:nucleotide-binding universal stress UspA family protein
MTRTVVIPLADPHQDQHGIAEQALICTRMLANAAATRILLLSAIDDDAQRAERQSYLDGIAATIDGEVTTTIENGDPAEAIISVAARQTDPLVIMASNGRQGAHLRRLGSVAATVARGATFPVMIMPVSAATDAPICKRIERVLLPINDIETIDSLIDAAVTELNNVWTLGGDFHLVEVTSPIPPQPAVTDGERYVDSHEVPAHFLRRAAELVESRGYRATWDLRIGDPAREIIRIASERGIDLIVMPAHSRHGFNSLIPGIFAAQVETAEPVPVLLVHPELPSLAGRQKPVR